MRFLYRMRKVGVTMQEWQVYFEKRILWRQSGLLGWNGWTCNMQLRGIFKTDCARTSVRRGATLFW